MTGFRRAPTAFRRSVIQPLGPAPRVPRILHPWQRAPPPPPPPPSRPGGAPAGSRRGGARVPPRRAGDVVHESRDQAHAVPDGAAPQHARRAGVGRVHPRGHLAGAPLSAVRGSALAARLVASAVAVFLEVLVVTVNGQLVRGPLPDDAPILRSALRWSIWWYPSDCWLYWAIVASDYGVTHYRRLRERELRASQLEAQPAI